MIFNYLYKHATKYWYFPSRVQDKKGRICSVLLKVFFCTKYHQTMHIEKLQAHIAYLEKENKRYAKNLDVILRIHAGCIEPFSPTPESSIEINQFADMDDASFLSMQKGS